MLNVNLTKNGEEKENEKKHAHKFVMVIRYYDFIIALLAEITFDIVWISVHISSEKFFSFVMFTILKKKYLP